MSIVHRREWLKQGAAGIGTAFAAPALAHERVTEFHFHHDHVIGTSLDLHVRVADVVQAEAAERIALDEIERLRRIFSIYDPGSEISRVNGARGPRIVSPELAELLGIYEEWQRRTGGVICAIPDGGGWRLDFRNRFVERFTPSPFNLNALGKAYIVEKAIAAVRRNVPVAGILLNIGGDIAAWGERWAVGIQNPHEPYDNAPPLGGVFLRNQAIASSGGYLRGTHIRDPRSGRTAGGVAGATVIAANCVTANALATALCILDPTAGLRLVAGIPDADCLIAAANGAVFRSPGLPFQEVRPVHSVLADDEKKADAWPDGFKVTVNLELPKVDAKRYRKPYVAVWIEDDKGTAVRTLAVWGNAPKYLKDLSDWWKIGKADNDLVKAVARATRGPGKYDLQWDGKDDKGKALPQGTYTVRVEVHREFGSHLRQTGKIECLGKAASAKMDKNAETGDTALEYGKPKK